MYCIECGSPIEATARICGTCRFPQPLEEFADLEPALAGAGARTAMPVRFIEAAPKPAKRTRLAPAVAVFIALCISTGLSAYLLTRQAPHTPTRAPAAAPAKAPHAEPGAASAATDKPANPEAGATSGGTKAD